MEFGSKDDNVLKLFNGRLIKPEIVTGDDVTDKLRTQMTSRTAVKVAL